MGFRYREGMSHFEIIAKDPHSKARAGILHTNHGPIETPVFMPVGTQATVKGMTPEMLTAMGAQIILGNTYHLSLRPGVDLIQRFGGLHSFMNWDKPILTDSGGYQVFSLKGMRKITSDGVTFQSHIDGSSHLFTPKRVIDLQLGFNSDIMMPLDICTPYPSEKEIVAMDMAQTFLWEKEAREYWDEKASGQLLFGLVQGGMHRDLRDESARDIVSLDFPGYAIGGLSVGEPVELLEEMTAFTAPLLPEDKPRYLMGVGLPENMRQAIESGIDMFDCVAPTRLARHGHFFTGNGKKNIKNRSYFDDLSPLDAECGCYACRHFSKAYIRHLMVTKEMMGAILMTVHNLSFLLNQVNHIRQHMINHGDA